VSILIGLRSPRGWYSSRCRGSEHARLQLRTQGLRPLKCQKFRRNFKALRPDSRTDLETNGAGMISVDGSDSQVPEGPERGRTAQDREAGGSAPAFVIKFLSKLQMVVVELRRSVAFRQMISARAAPSVTYPLQDADPAAKRDASPVSPRARPPARVQPRVTCPQK
jgi:hypothetical protein